MPRKKKPVTLLDKVRANEALISRILGLVIVIVTGVMLYNYFQGMENGEITPESETTEVTNGEIVFREGEDGMVPANLPENHVVAAGEDLWKIAEIYYGSGYNWVDIAQANNLTNPNLIEVGQELTLPEVAVKQLTVNVMGVQTANVIGGTEYTVQKGDHLWSIAVRAYGDGYRWSEIAQANQLTNPNIIEPGQVLALPRD